MTYTFTATIRLSGGVQQKIQVQADDSYKARKMIEAQYGVGSIVSGPTKSN